MHKKYINIELYLPYIDILEDILTHISERLLHITLDCCYISHWTVATYHTFTLDCGSPFGIILQRIVTYLAYLAILRTNFRQLFHINVRQNTM